MPAAHPPPTGALTSESVLPAPHHRRPPAAQPSDHCLTNTPVRFPLALYCPLVSKALGFAHPPAGPLPAVQHTPCSCLAPNAHLVPAGEWRLLEEESALKTRDERVLSARTAPSLSCTTPSGWLPLRALLEPPCLGPLRVCAPG